MAAAKKVIKKAQRGVIATADSSGYFKKQADSLLNSSNSKYSKGDFKGGKKDSNKSIKALYDVYRQSEKARPGKDANGFPIKKNKTGGVTKAKDGKWIQKAINPKHKGYCTPETKATCTPKRKALAHTLRKMAKKK